MHFFEPEIQKVWDDVAAVELFRSAMYLRQLVLNQPNTIPSVPTAEQLKGNVVAAPNAIFNFLALVLCGEDGTDGEISMEKRVG